MRRLSLVLISRSVIVLTLCAFLFIIPVSVMAASYSSDPGRGDPGHPITKSDSSTQTSGSLGDKPTRSKDKTSTSDDTSSSSSDSNGSSIWQTALSAIRTIINALPLGDDPTPTPSPTPTPTPLPSPTPKLPPCASWSDGVCQKVSTSLGDNVSVETSYTGFIMNLFSIVLSISGAVALYSIIVAGYKLMTSSGKPEKVQQGRDQLISAVVGITFIIFSFVIFRLIAVDLLKIPFIK